MPDTSAVAIESPKFEIVSDGALTDEAIEALATMLLEMAEQQPQGGQE